MSKATVLMRISIVRFIFQNTNRHHPPMFKLNFISNSRSQFNKKNIITASLITYQEAKIEADDDGVGNGDGSEFDLTEVAGEGLSYDIHGVGGDAAEDGGAHYLP